MAGVERRADVQQAGDICFLQTMLQAQWFRSTEIYEQITRLMVEQRLLPGQRRKTGSSQGCAR